MFDKNDVTNTIYGGSIPDNNELGFDGYPFEATNAGPSTLDGLSAGEIENWWLAPNSDGNAGQYAGSTLLDAFRDEPAGLYDTQYGYTLGTAGANTSESHSSLSSVTNNR